LLWLGQAQAFGRRMRLLELALEDYAEQRYHACVPVVLAQVDGACHDVGLKKLFHREHLQHKVKLPEAWDSISAHPEALTKLVRMFSEERLITSTDNPSMPYRNGILHGRDLGYDNQMVAAKVWALLFSIRDLVVKHERREAQPRPPERRPSFRELLAQIGRTELQKRAIATWQPRHVSLASLPNDWRELPDGTPERRAGEFCQAWQDRNYRAMAELVGRSPLYRGVRDRADRLRELFGHKALADFRVCSVEDEAPAVTTVHVRVRYQLGRLTPVEKMIPLRIIYEDPEGHPLVRNTSGGEWTVNDTSALREEPLEM
jgi:hypothetical protein